MMRRLIGATLVWAGFTIPVFASVLQEEDKIRTISQNSFDIHQVTCGDLESILDFLIKRQETFSQKKTITTTTTVDKETNDLDQSTVIENSFIPPIKHRRTYKLLKSYMIEVIFVKHEMDLYGEATRENRASFQPESSSLYASVTATDDRIISRAHVPYAVTLDSNDMLSCYQEQLRQRNIAFAVDLYNLAEGNYEKCTKDVVPTLKKMNELLRKKEPRQAEIKSAHKFQTKPKSSGKNKTSSDSFLSHIKRVTRAFSVFEKEPTKPHHRKLVLATKKLDAWLDKTMISVAEEGKSFVELR
jgi:hypothetical protein